MTISHYQMKLVSFISLVVILNLQAYAAQDIKVNFRTLDSNIASKLIEASISTSEETAQLDKPFFESLVRFAIEGNVDAISVQEITTTNLDASTYMVKYFFYMQEHVETHECLVIELEGNVFLVVAPHFMKHFKDQ